LMVGVDVCVAEAFLTEDAKAHDLIGGKPFSSLLVCFVSLYTGELICELTTETVAHLLILIKCLLQY
jgi:hypothetical protein